MSKNILITGASGAFGKLTVMALLKAKHRVVASMRDINGKNKKIAQELEYAGAFIVEIDVTDEQSVMDGVKLAIRHLKTLDVLINNAGIGAYGLQESFTPDDWKHIFDVNVFGVQRVNRAVLPLMRNQNNGLIIHISSLIGRMILPYWGVYSASKWALEAMAESYRVELSTLGIDSCIIEPGPYPTTFFTKLFDASDTKCDKDYGDISDKVKSSFIDFGNFLESNIEQNPNNIADAILKLINTSAGKRDFRTVVDNIGIGQYISKYNNKLEEITLNIYKNFGITNLEHLKI